MSQNMALGLPNCRSVRYASSVIPPALTSRRPPTFRHYVILGQLRATAALALGANVGGHGLNLLAHGAPGSGKTTLICECLERQAGGQPVLLDVCHVDNSTDPRRPSC
jgi:Flp pilus assembly CpaF family ATPase